ncbi:MAG: hypothetical protein QG670_984 [Thermoproteota archaeon]|nr:hypothetical protein [Thermoproteota archaeon]
MLFFIVYVTETIFTFNLRIFVIPVFNILSPLSRAGMFLLLIPFYLIYFLAEGLYLHEFHDWSGDKYGLVSQVRSISKAVCVRICPYVGLVCINYLPLFLLNLRVFPVFLGFLMEFFWGIVPLFIVSVALSWWMYRSTSSIGIGAILNALLFAWSSAGIFPLSA